MRTPWLAVLCLFAGCYHYSFEQNATGAPVVTHKVRVPTYINGFVGTGSIDTRRYCENPVSTELRVRASDVLISIATLLIYTPHTLYVRCPITEPGTRAAQR